MRNILKIFASFLLAVIGIPQLSAQMMPSHAEITQITGDVEIIDAFGVNAQLRPGSKIQPGSEIRTFAKAQVKLAFANGIRATVEAGTVARITKFAITRTDDVRESNFMRISTNKEPSLSSTELNVVSGRVLVEVPPLNLPVSNFRVVSDFHRATIQKPKDVVNEELLKKPVIMRFEQGIDFGRLTVYQGVVYSSPNYKDLGVPSDILEGLVVTYRFKKGPLVEPVHDADKAASEIADPIIPPENLVDPEQPTPEQKDKYIPGPPGGPVDETIIITTTPPKKPKTAAGLP